MAVCSFCDREMTKLVACTVLAYDDFPDGVRRERIAYPDDVLAGEYARKEAPTAGDWPAHCCDCGTPQGHVHHPGCCVERCPLCQGQAISCECATSEEDDE